MKSISLSQHADSRPRARAILGALLSVCLVLPACKRTSPGGTGAAGTSDSNEAPKPTGPSYFRDATGETGLDFVHFTGATGKYYMPEIMGSGVALLDYDNDGDLDVYLIQAGMLMPDEDYHDALFPPKEGPPFRNRLFRNDLISPAQTTPGPLHFTDVTDASGAGDTGYGVGCAVADYDNDGDQDIYVSNYGPNALYRNNGDGTLTNVMPEAHADTPLWSTSAAFGDYDGDGWLDLAVVNYVAFADDINKACKRASGDRDYCTPLVYQPQPDALFHNNGDGTFTDVTQKAGLDKAFGSGLGVIWDDFDNDNRLDLYVANDGRPNQLWHNLGNATFEEIALQSGAALNESGDAEASMGVTVADVNRDGLNDIFLTHLYGETNTLYVNRGGGFFSDQTFRYGLGAPSRANTGFGTSFFDFDRDGLLDVYVVGGAVTIVDSQIGQPYPYLMPKLLFKGADDGRFEDVSAQAGPSFALLESSRGSAMGDLDLDGDVDLVVANNNGPARILLNESKNNHHWIAVRLDTGGANRDGLGSRIGLERSSEPVWYERMRTDGSYCSANPPEVRFGLGDSDDRVALVVTWPDGERERWSGLAVDRVVTLRRGEGEVVR